MRYMNMALLIAVMVFSVGSVKANEPSRSTDWEWVDYDGEDELPDNVVTSRNGGEGNPICSAPVPGTSEYRVGWLNVRKLKYFIPGATQEEKRYAAIEGIRVLVHRQPDQQVFHFVPYDEWLAGPQTWPWNREICASYPDGDKKVKVGSLHRGHRCISVGWGQKTHVLEKPDFMVLISTPEEQAEAEAEEQVEASAETEEEAENKIARMEALDNLSDAMEEMFSTCDFNQGSGNYDDNSTIGLSLPLADYRNGARHALAQTRKQMRKGSVDTESINESFTECDSMGKKKGAKYPYKPKMNCFRELFDTVAEAEAEAQGMDAKVRPLLGRLAKDGKRIAPLARHDGIAQDLSYFIASIGQREFKGTYRAYLAKL